MNVWSHEGNGMKKGKIKERFLKLFPDVYPDTVALGHISYSDLTEIVDEALAACPLKIACVYHDNQGRISGFRFESLKIDGKKFAPTANDVMNAFAKWLVEQFGEPK